MVADEGRRVGFTTAQGDYLKALYHLGGHERPVPTGELAQRLGISPASVSEMVSRLAEQGVIVHDRYRGQQLTEEGRRAALELIRHHRLLEMFLVQALGYDWDEVHEEAERLEHVISERMEARIDEVLGRPELDPHGHAIPTPEGDLRTVSERRLSDCLETQEVVIRMVSDDDPDRLRELQRRGLVPGAKLRILAAPRYESPIEVQMGEQRVGVPLGLARETFVDEVKE
jgi:DtxR family transcriptional regulator, Mn-dependent transcriptional regulator